MFNSLMSLGIKPRAQRAAAGTANKAITLTNVVESLGMIANTAGAAMLSVWGGWAHLSIKMESLLQSIGTLLFFLYAALF